MSTVLIVGANSDIAKATARVYAACGYDLVLSLRNKNNIEPFVSDLKIKYENHVETIELDILDYPSHSEIYSRLKRPIDGVIMAVGYLGDQHKSQADFKESQTIINSNFTGPVSLLNIIGNDFEKRKTGFIVGISSVAGDRGRKKNYQYGAAKAGFSAYLSGLRNRLCSKGVHVLTVKPGFVLTKMTQDLDLPEKLTAQPKEIAQAIYRAQQKGKDTLYYMKKWRLIMWIIRMIPEKIFKRLDL
ncbi:MAG: SDR family oxidoreductase [Marinicellaceae bacterium]